MKLFGAGVGRTGTLSLKFAINRLGLGLCHHMEVVLHDMSRQVPLWSAALDGGLTGMRFTRASTAQWIDRPPASFGN